MRARLAALVVCLCFVGCGDDDAVPPGTDAVPPGTDAVPPATEDGGTPPVSISFNLKPDHYCKYVAAPSVVFYPIGRFDVAAQGRCDHPYAAHLLVRSVWRNELPVNQRLSFDSATITLQSLDKKLLQFGDALHNPFLVTTKLTFESTAGAEKLGVADFEMIPVAYKKDLERFVGKQILAKVEIHGSTSSGETIEPKPFVYPIELCSGCLTVCSSGLEKQQMTRQDVVGDRCDDNSGNDDRICFDDDC